MELTPLAATVCTRASVSKLHLTQRTFITIDDSLHAYNQYRVAIRLLVKFGMEFMPWLSTAASHFLQLAMPTRRTVQAVNWYYNNSTTHTNLSIFIAIGIHIVYIERS